MHEQGCNVYIAGAQRAAHALQKRVQPACQISRGNADAVIKLGQFEPSTSDSLSPLVSPVSTLYSGFLSKSCLSSLKKAECKLLTGETKVEGAVRGAGSCISTTERMNPFRQHISCGK